MGGWLVAVVVGHISASLVHAVLLIVAVELLNIQTAASLIVTERGSGTWFKGHVATCSSLSVKVLSEVCNWSLFVLIYHVSTRLRPITHMVNVILSLLEPILPSLLVLKNLGQNALRLQR
jgi:hypothetical protein